MIDAAQKPVSTAVEPIDKFLTAHEVAAILPLHPVTILKWAREGKIPHRRLGRKVVFPLRQLRIWLESEYTDSAVHAAITERMAA